MMYHNPQAEVQVKGRCSTAFAIERSVRQGCPLSPLLYVLALEPLLHRLRDEETNLALRGVPFAGSLTARVSAFADDITSLCIPPPGYRGCEEGGWRVRAKVNFEKSEGLRIGAGGVVIPF